MHVLISIQQKVPQWQIPEAAARAIIARFPEITFTYAVTDHERRRALETAEVAYTWILGADELARAPRLQWVHTSAVAVETLCLPELQARGVRVSNTRGVQAVPIAEHVMAVVLSLAKQLPFALDEQRQARWSQREFVGPRLPWLLAGRTLGLIGMGTIGTEIARRGAAFDMRVVALRRRADGDPIPGVSRTFQREGLTDFLAECDVLVIAAPLTPATSGLVDRAAIARLKRGSVVVNVGRAPILDTDALVEALQAGHVAGAALDVCPQEPLPPDHPLWRCPNVILTPHTSGFRHGHWDEVIEVFADNLDRFRRGLPLRFQVSAEYGY
jgi:phosphoglycerate dehydrogenase-like enzyme